MNVPLTQLLVKKEEELKLFEFAVQRFCDEVNKTLKEAQRLSGQLQVISLLSELIEKASFSAELVNLKGGISGLKLKISFPKEELEYETEPLALMTSLGEKQLLSEEFFRSVRKFIEFLLENLWKFFPRKCQAGENGGDSQ